MKKASHALYYLLIFSTPIIAQHSDSLPSANNISKIRKVSHQLYAPLFLIAGGIAINGRGEESIKNEVVEERFRYIPNFHTHIDNYLQYSPIAIAYGLDALGIGSKTDLANRTAIMIKAELLMTATVFSLKKITRQPRPDGSSRNSFPSGHTAQAFVAATFLSKEYGEKIRWMPYAAFGIASSVGILRMANNRHFVSDVLAGAGFGILSTKVSYWTHQYHWAPKHKFQIAEF